MFGFGWEDDDDDIIAALKGIAIKELFLNHEQFHFISDNIRTGASVNYFAGEKNKWQSNIPSTGTVHLQNVWPYIDVDLRAHAKNLEKVFKIAPQGNVTNIKLSLVGIKGVWVDKQTGELSIDTTLGITKMSHPIAYQDIDNIRKYAKVDYVVYGNSYGFVLSGYDPRYTLVIDPILSSTFIGGAAEDFLSAVSCSLEIFSTSNFPNDNSLLFTFARCNSFNSLISSIG